MSTPSIEIEEGMFAYGISPNSKREGVIGWISKINVEKRKVGISYRDGRTATWNVRNIVVAHSEEAYEEGVTGCEMYLKFMQTQSRKTYKKRQSYQSRVESAPRTVPPDDPGSPIRSRGAHGIGAEPGIRNSESAIQELTDTIRELLHITRETSDRVRGLEERVSRVEAESSDAMSGATTQAESVIGGEIGEFVGGNL